MSEDMFSKMARWTNEARDEKQTTDKVTGDFKQRVADEKAALDEKRGKLEHFMLQPAFLDLPQAERNRLMRQSVAMEQYSQVLFERLEADFQ